MDAKKLDKKKISNWVDGDTFIVKIDNVSEEYQEYEDKYLALIYKNDYTEFLGKNNVEGEAEVVIASDCCYRA